MSLYRIHRRIFTHIKPSRLSQFFLYVNNVCTMHPFIIYCWVIMYTYIIYIVYTYYMHIIMMSAFILQSLHFVYMCACVYVLRIAANFNVWNTRLFYPLYICIHNMYVCMYIYKIYKYNITWFFFQRDKELHLCAN